MMYRIFAPALAAALAGCVQAPPPVPPAAPSVATAAPAPPPRQSCPKQDSAETIMRVQPASEQLIERLRPNPGFGGAWFESSPCYLIVFALADPALEPKVIEAAPEHLRPHIAFARSTFSQAERDLAGQQIMAALSARKISFVFSPQVRPERFWIGVRTEADAALARTLIPERYRAITVVEPGGYTEPVPER